MINVSPEELRALKDSFYKDTSVHWDENLAAFFSYVQCYLLTHIQNTLNSIDENTSRIE